MPGSFCTTDGRHAPDTLAAELEAGVGNYCPGGELIEQSCRPSAAAVVPTWIISRCRRGFSGSADRARWKRAPAAYWVTARRR